MIAALSSLDVAAATGGKRASFLFHNSCLSGQRSSLNVISSSLTVKTLMTSLNPARRSATR